MLRALAESRGGAKQRCGSLKLDAGGRNHLVPLLQLGRDEPGELVGRVAYSLATMRAQVASCAGIAVVSSSGSAGPTSMLDVVAGAGHCDAEQDGL